MQTALAPPRHKPTHFRCAQLIVAGSLIGLFLAVRFVLFEHLPEKYFIDSGRLSDLVQSGNFDENSTGVTAFLLSMVPEVLWPFVNATIAVALALWAATSSRSYKALALVILVFPPLMVLTLLVPSKETIVVLLALGVLCISKRFSGISLIAAILILYGTYGATVRSYYLLIATAFVFLLVLRRLSPGLRILCATAFFGILLVVPGDIFYALQGTRDTTNLAASYVMASDNRTAFFNPYATDTASGFLANYVYAALLLNMPFIKFLSLSELVLFVNILLYGTAMVAGLRSTSTQTRLLSTLFASHILVLWLFEPDLGSYFRHFSSAFPYLIPALAELGSKALPNTSDDVNPT